MYCAQCGRALLTNQNFCPSCGTGVDAGSVSRTRAPGARSVDRRAYAGFWRRFLGFVVDCFVSIFAFVFVTALSGTLRFASDRQQGYVGLFYFIFIYLFPVFYSVLMESSRFQATVGKLVVGVRVTDLEGNRISIARALGRCFSHILDGLTLGIGYAMVAFTERRQGLHDLVAGTLVIRRSFERDAIDSAPLAPTSGLSTAGKRPPGNTIRTTAQRKVAPEPTSNASETANTPDPLLYSLFILFAGCLLFVVLALQEKAPLSADTSASPPPSSVYSVKSAGLNCRESGDAHSSVRERLSQNSLVVVVERLDGWARVRTEKTTDCWVRESLLAPETGIGKSSNEAVSPKAQGFDIRSLPSTPEKSTDQSRTAGQYDENSKITRIPLAYEGGTLVAAVFINDTITLKFTIDSGAADVVIPADVFATLVRAGTVSDSDSWGPGQYVYADGEVHESPRFIIRSLQIGDVEVANILAAVGPPKASLLLGQSFLSRFRNWSIDNTSQQLILQE